jgi:hypothetical protein
VSDFSEWHSQRYTRVFYPPGRHERTLQDLVDRDYISGCVTISSGSAGSAGSSTEETEIPISILHSSYNRIDKAVDDAWERFKP